MAERPTVDGELDAGDVLRLVGREVHDTGGDVGRLAEARNHDVPLERRPAAGVAQDVRHHLGAGVDEADDDRVGPDVVLAEVDGELPRHRVDGALGGVVGGALGQRRLRRAGRDVHDRAAARLAHLGHRVLAGPVGAVERDAHDVVERVVVDDVDVAVPAAARVVGDGAAHERREGTEALDGRAHRAGDLLLDPAVGPQVHRLTAGREHARLDLATEVLRPAGEGHRRALGGEHLDDPAPDAAGAAGDQRDLALEPGRRLGELGAPGRRRAGGSPTRAPAGCRP